MRHIGADDRRVVVAAFMSLRSRSRSPGAARSVLAWRSSMSRRIGDNVAFRALVSSEAGRGRGALVWGI